MLTIEDLERVQDQELKDLLVKFNQLHRLDDNEFYKIVPDNNTYIAQIIRNDLAIYIYKKLVNPELLYALNIPDNLKYTKKKEISNSILLERCNIDYWLINGILWMPSGYCTTESLVEFIMQQNIDVDRNILTSIKNFVTDKSNSYIIKPSKSIYLPLEEEIRRLKDVIFYKATGYMNAPKELNDYVNSEYQLLGARCIQLDKEEDIKRWAFQTINSYQNKRIGNIGEYYHQRTLENANLHPQHISKNNGDGFGYDHLCSFPWYEDLTETKATLSDGVNDSIKITENEYNTMIDTLGLNYSNYYISRVFINPTDFSFKRNALLVPKDDKTLVPFYDTGYTYEYDHDDNNGKVFIKK